MPIESVVGKLMCGPDEVNAKRPVTEGERTTVHSGTGL